MNIGFRDWLIEDSNKWTREEKQNFLRMAKFEPDRAVQIISENLADWATVYCSTKGAGVVVANLHTAQADADELFTAYKEHFALELAAITQ